MNDNPSTNWWQRHWKWAVPVGCTGMIALFVLALGGFFLLIIGSMKSSDVYEQALTQARAHPGMQRALGEPIEDGPLPHGSISIEGSSGQADFTIPLSGPNGEATLYVVGEKRAGEWDLVVLEAKLPGNGRRVDLLGGL